MVCCHYLSLVQQKLVFSLRLKNQRTVALDNQQGAKTMLILTRDTRNDTIRIGDDIEIKVYQVQGNQVRIAIEAPKEVNIVRGELKR